MCVNCSELRHGPSHVKSRYCPTFPYKIGGFTSFKLVLLLLLQEEVHALSVGVCILRAF